MGSRAIYLLRGGTSMATATIAATSMPSLPMARRCLFTSFMINSGSCFCFSNARMVRNYSAKSSSAIEPPNLHRLAETARISLTPEEAEEFAPKMQQVVDWFGQLQSVDLQSFEPAIRTDTKEENLRDDLPETFENREAIVAAIPSYNEPYIKVPKVLNKE